MYQTLLSKKLSDLKASGQYRTFVTLNRICGQYPLAQLEGGDERPVIVWCSNDYLGMSQHLVVRQAMHDAIDRYGAGSGGSRNIGGSHGIFSQLERSLADWHSKEAALVFPTGFSSNDATLQCLLREIPDCVVISDEKNHASIINGIRATSTERQVFRHNDLDHLEESLARYPLERPKIVVFESVYSMDGDISPMAEIVDIAKQYNALTYLDEVHAVGMYGPRGAGLAAQLGIADKVDIIQGTMAKAIGVIGGYITGAQWLIDAVRSFSTGFIFTTSLPPVVAAGCLASIEHLKTQSQERELLHTKTQQLRQALDSLDIPVMSCSSTHVLPVLVGDAIKCKEAAERLLSVHGVYLQPINFPSVAAGTERFRVNVTPNHTDEQVTHLAEALREVFEHFDIPLKTPPAFASAREAS
ncbi:5-aminolevulinate synthase [Bordetella petrii]|uniref:5-aminolevulinate synthase n=1 Tax=Bordetella petrii (strain ATCC BAA-461 / DSM 12804 / CCUG 43448 / CIP 107267 / Se-1111R) TaxID=340100 RepID=A9IE11_BORPD|nr:MULTISPECIES: 5-aminolevulinate synthase [Pseudomonadota]CAP41660.1 5-aminolevulinic acid synthase [Bordetella petrii]HCK4605719.1 5-aminolevulinate synthase [Pseudomonas aeruginosa]